MFSTEEFQSWAKDHAVLFNSIMTHIDDREHDDLLRTYGFRGFPSMALLDHEGTALVKKIGRSVEAVKTAVSSANEYLQLKAKKEAGENVDPVKFYFTQLRLGVLDSEKAKQGLAELELSDQQADEADRLILGLEVGELLDGLQSRSLEQQAIADKIYGFYKNGRTLPEGAELRPFYMGMLLEAAQKKDDGKAFLAAFPTVRGMLEGQLKQSEGILERVRGNPRYEQQYQQRVDQLKKQIDTLQRKADEYSKAD